MEYVYICLFQLATISGNATKAVHTKYSILHVYLDNFLFGIQYINLQLIMFYYYSFQKHYFSLFGQMLTTTITEFIGLKRSAGRVM